MNEISKTSAASWNFYEASVLSPNYLWDYSITLDGPEMKVFVFFFLIPDHSHFKLLCGLKAQPYTCDPVSSEPARPPGEHLEVTWALLVFSRVCGSHQLCWNRLCVPLPLFPYPSTTVFTPCLVVQEPTALPWLIQSLLLCTSHPPLKKNSKELFFPKPLDTRNLSRGVRKWISTEKSWVGRPYTCRLSF